MPATALQHFDEDIGRARAIIAHADPLPHTNAAEQTLRSDLLRSGWMFAVGALERLSLVWGEAEEKGDWLTARSAHENGRRVRHGRVPVPFFRGTFRVPSPFRLPGAREPRTVIGLIPGLSAVEGNPIESANLPEGGAIWYSEHLAPESILSSLAATNYEAPSWHANASSAAAPPILAKMSGLAG